MEEKEKADDRDEAGSQASTTDEAVSVASTTSKTKGRDEKPPPAPTAARSSVATPTTVRHAQDGQAAAAQTLRVGGSSGAAASTVVDPTGSPGTAATAVTTTPTQMGGGNKRSSLQEMGATVARPVPSPACGMNAALTSALGVAESGIANKRENRTAVLPAKGQRSDIQSLRALAVVLVVIFHLEPQRGFFSSGFIGVDVFFVVSGYLVFGSLLVSAASGNPPPFLEFLGRRIKRLSLPSAVTLTLLAVLLLSGMRGCSLGLCMEQYEAIRAAALHYVNVHFLANSADYWGDTTHESTVLHFWSLAVEEHLYVLIPAVLWVCRAVGRSSRWAGDIGMGLLMVASFLSTWVQPASWRFYFFASRFWEFAVGAFIARFEHVRRCPHTRWSLVLYIAALLGIAILGCVTPSSNYPNPYTVVIVGLAGFLLWARYDVHIPVVETIGNMSYSIYLYHWPVIRLLRYYALVHWPRMPVVALAVALSVALAALSYRLVELPIRQGKWSSRTVVMILLLCTGVPAALAHYGTVKSAGENPLAHPLPITILTVPVAAVTFPWHLSNPITDLDELIRSTEGARKPAPWNNVLWGKTYLSGKWGLEKRGDGERAVLLKGDSHSSHWFPATRAYAAETNASLHFRISGGPNTCFKGYYCNEQLRMRDPVPEFLTAKFRLVVLSGVIHPQCEYSQFVSVISYWANISSCLVLVGDTPHWGDHGFRSACGTVCGAVQCVLEHRNDVEEMCHIPYTNSTVGTDIRYLHQLQREQPWIAAKTDIVDINDALCWGKWCPAHIGNVQLYKDTHHLSVDAIELLVPTWTARFHATKCHAMLMQSLSGRGV